MTQSRHHPPVRLLSTRRKRASQSWQQKQRPEQEQVRDERQVRGAQHQAQLPRLLLLLLLLLTLAGGTGTAAPWRGTTTAAGARVMARAQVAQRQRFERRRLHSRPACHQDTGS